MLHLNYMAFIVPLFFLIIWLEYWWLSKTNKAHYYAYEDTVANISLGMADRLLSLFVTGTFAATYYWLHANFAIFDIGRDIWIWIVLLLTTDLVWYWYHRLGHEINVFWAIHIVHHQSEYYNYSVASRLTILQGSMRHLYWCSLPVIGFQPDMVIAMVLVHGTYSFFTHTQMVGKLGWLEHILVTPSIHGVHHASNEKYLDKNYGDIFVIWDKLFGTFQKEEEKPVYGLTKPLQNYSFLWQHVHYFAEMIEACRKKTGIWNKLKIIFGKPSDFDPEARPAAENKWLPHKKYPKGKGVFKGYTNLQLFCCVTGLFIFWLFIHYVPFVHWFFISLVILFTLINCGALLEQRRWIYLVEYLRLITLFTWAFVYFQSIPLYVLALVVLSLIWYATPTQNWYFKLIYAHKVENPVL